MAAHLQEEANHLEDALKRNEEDVIKLEAKLREARAKKAAIQARHNTVSNTVRIRRNLNDNRIQDAFDRFDKVDARLDRLEAEAESMELGKGQTLAEEIAGLEADDEIEQELEALKAKAAGTANDNKKAPASKAKKKAASK